MSSNIQFDKKNGTLKHFIGIEGLKRELLLEILDRADAFIDPETRQIKKGPLLRGKSIINLFFEPSTRTRTTFELAAKSLNAGVLNFNINASSTSKGETLTDMLRNLEAMHCDMFVVRHNASGAAHFIASQVAPHIHVINAGDGSHEHPTQAMLDMLTIRQFKHDFAPLRVAIVGDILHSRVARSQIHALNTIGVAEIRVIAPDTLIPKDVNALGVQVYRELHKGLHNVDVIIMLRLQRERMESNALLPGGQEFYRLYGLTEKALGKAKDDAIVMHPGPINRGVEIASPVADCKSSVILHQVSNGIAVRMAIMAMILGGNLPESGSSET